VLDPGFAGTLHERLRDVLRQHPAREVLDRERCFAERHSDVGGHRFERGLAEVGRERLLQRFGVFAQELLDRAELLEPPCDRPRTAAAERFAQSARNCRDAVARRSVEYEVSSGRSHDASLPPAPVRGASAVLRPLAFGTRGHNRPEEVSPGTVRMAAARRDPARYRACPQMRTKPDIEPAKRWSVSVARLGSRVIRRIDLAAERAGFVAPRFDEFLEALEVLPHVPLDHADRVADVFDDAFRLIVHLQRHAALVVRDAMERYDPGVERTARARPRNAFVRGLLGDLRGPFLGLAADLGLPAQSVVVD